MLLKLPKLVVNIRAHFPKLALETLFQVLFLGIYIPHAIHSGFKLKPNNPKGSVFPDGIVI
jgi:hypothetical protein